MEARNNILILDKINIQERIRRIAYQILEDCFEDEELVLAGLAERGYIFAQRLANELSLICDKSILLISLDIDKQGSVLDGRADIPVEQATNKAVILIDDVLNSGRALAYGLGMFLDIPLKKMRTAVLIDRSHRKFPIVTDFTGLQLSTVLNEQVSVHFEEIDGEDAAYLN
ncbi:phosphoribosyltransferase family protein [Olivibacter sitiensis]|uniref:phosphoribosyltransferase family protein n=1 Tax=Olivibacter sitiensis TaxID=376470 RepID=UPI000408223F|nr:phosphoribosyltransferase family protein [Olivibacter sitiensis]